MWICIKINGKTVCFWLPIFYQKPIIRIPPDPGPYRELLLDASILGLINEATKDIKDEAVKHAVHNGVTAGLKAMQSKAGGDFSLSFDTPRH